MQVEGVFNQQIALIESLDILIKERISQQNTTNSLIGVVKSDPKNYICPVDIKDEEYTCTVPEHLHSWIQKDDVVIVQDLYNDGKSKVIIGKTGQIQKHPSVVIFDEETNKNISGVDGVFDGDKKINYSQVFLGKEFE